MNHDCTCSKLKRILLLMTAAALVVVPAIAASAQEAAKTPAKAEATLASSDDPAVWGRKYPAQYKSYQKTVDQVRTKYGGSEAMPRTPTDADPRSTIARSKLEQDPRLKTMWAGYAFSVDYRERRGHAYMLMDQTFTGRQKTNPPAMCINCHASTVKMYEKLGNGDIMKGFDELERTHPPYKEVRTMVEHPIACIDCHEPQTMKLRITRPAFIEGIRALKASQGVKDFDVNTMASKEEMRSYVCAQCHVTYYFKGAGKRLTYPWSKGLKVENIVEVEDGVSEWIHPETGAKMIKPRHPEFEMWNQGMHAQAGVACVDCHMPAMKQGKKTVTDHQVNSPLLKMNAACSRCHDMPSDQLKAKVEKIQDNYLVQRNLALDALMDLIRDLKAAKDKGTSDADLAVARDYQRKGQFYIDFIMSENSMGFHAPEESLRILTDGAKMCRLGQAALKGEHPKAAHASTITTTAGL